MNLVENYILKQVAGRNLPKQEAKSMLQELQQTKQPLKEDIAIIGMAGKFPGAKDINEFWANLKQGKVSIRDFPEQRSKEWISALENDTVLEFLLGKSLPEGVKLEDIVGGYGGFLEEIDKFDAPFFRLSPREAKFMDPAQRLFLETAWQAIEDAGYGGNKIYGTKTGVFVGKDHATLPMYRLMTEPDQMHLTGSWPGILASRISYIFNLKGPSLVVDTACSAGLVSLHSACQSLKNKECDMAIAGGIQVQYMSLKEESGPMDLGMVESGDGSVCTFDRKASGTVWSEAVVALLLKPLSKAIEDGDNICAVIKGSAINNDGASNGITAPNAKAQEDVIISAWEEAGINPETITYIEAHGTGTSLGDPIEIKGLTNAFGHYTDKKQFCGIGSVKTNIGHTVAASGLVSLIKVVMSMKHGEIPASLNFNEPNPYINFVGSPIYINDQLYEWEKTNSPRRAAINSFGFSGTNAHVVVEEAPNNRDICAESIKKDLQIFALSARNENTLRTLVKHYRNYLNNYEELNLENICFTANTGRGHYTHRLAMIVKDINDLKAKVTYLAEQESFSSLNISEIVYGEHRVVSESQKVNEGEAITQIKYKQLNQSAEKIIREYKNETYIPMEILSNVCTLYVQGANIVWDELYEGQERKRISVPVYPLERIRNWANTKVFEEKVNKDKNRIKHPLLDRCLVDSIYQAIYETELSLETHWVLKDHQFMGSYILPGVTYLEWAREACNRHFDGRKLHMKDVVFLEPLVVQEGENKKVQTVLKKESDHLAWSIVSKNKSNSLEKEDSWIIHAEGKAYRIYDKELQRLSIEDIKTQVPIEEKLGEFHNQSGQFLLTNRWDNVEEVYTSADKKMALIRMTLPDEYLTEMEDFHYHPSLLDNAVNADLKFIDGVYLPFNFKSFKMFSRMPKVFYSWFRKKTNNSRNREILNYDITLFDENGNVFGEIVDYYIKKMGAIEQIKFKQMNGQEHGNYKINWVEEALSKDVLQMEHKNVLMFTNGNDATSMLVEQLRSENKEVIEVRMGDKFYRNKNNEFIISSSAEDYRKLISAIKDKKITQIIHALTLTEKKEIDKEINFEEGVQRGVLSLFYLTKALLDNKIPQKIDLVILSSHIQEVTGNEDFIQPLNAAIMGVGKVLKEEYEHIECRCIDVDVYTSIQNISRELKCQMTKYLVAYRHNLRHIQELRKFDFSQSMVQPIEMKSSGVYIITGGTGGLGMEMAKYLSSKGKINIALLNRSAMPPKEKWSSLVKVSQDKKLVNKLLMLLDVQKNGSEVSCFSVNVADEVNMQLIIDKLRIKYGKINGIIHAAGVAGDGFIINKDESTLKNVLSPKMDGTWVLDRVTKNDQLDFLVLFSSIASLLGGPGQGDYTAANLYLDSFADSRNKENKRTISINWPSWKETGMAVEYGMVDEDTLFLPITTKQAQGVMDTIFDYNITHIIPGEVNYPILMQYKDELPIKLSEQLEMEMSRISVPTKASKNVKPKKTIDQIAMRGKSQFTETEKQLGLIWAQVLELDIIDIYESFNDVGGDSILAIQLYKQINDIFPKSMEISDVFTYSSIVEQAEYIDSQNGNSDKELINFLDALEAGEASVEEGLHMINSQKVENLND